MQKEEQLLEKRLIDLSRRAYYGNTVTYSDFLNLNELNILNSIPKDSLYSNYVTYGGFDFAERQMAAFLPDALSLRTQYADSCFESTDELLRRKNPDGTGKDANLHELFSTEMAVLRICPLNERFAGDLSHRDFLGAVLNLGIDRSKTGDILVDGQSAVLFAAKQLEPFITENLSRVRHTSVKVMKEKLTDFKYLQRYETVEGTVASVRLDSLLSLAFSSSRSKLTGLIEGGKVYVNGRLITTNAYQVNEYDRISVRGVGKFEYVGSAGITKKNRVRVIIHKYIG